MTGIFLLDWAIMAVSLFNTILLTWLGLTVLLNAERPAAQPVTHNRRGIWMAGGGLLMGGVFFLAHSAILGMGTRYLASTLNFWWRIGWVPITVLPLAWYAIMLWYAGYWDERETPLHHRHRTLSILAYLVSGGTIGLIFLTHALPSFNQAAQLDLTITPSIGGIPILTLVYPVYLVICLGFSLDVLIHPGPSNRVMGQLARCRARPWLVAATIVQLLASLLVGWVILWVTWRYPVFDLDQVASIASLDLAIASLIAVANLLVGQAIVSYEVFTGKTIPRRGIYRYWRRAVILAAGYGALIGASQVLPVPPIYSLLLSAMLITIFYALLVWRSFIDREQFFQHLRPFTYSQRLYDQLLANPPDDSPKIAGNPQFEALCGTILGSRIAGIYALGPLASLVHSPLVFPQEFIPAVQDTAGIGRLFTMPHTLCVPLQAEHSDDFSWAVPLWSERGLTGLLLLGEKIDGSLYTQEEIEIARSTAERLLDTQASTEIARRLMALQRQRLAESQVLDRQARRMLHDEVLPRLHATLLALNENPGRNGVNSEAIGSLVQIHHQLSNLLRDLPTAPNAQLVRHGLVGAIRQVVEIEYRQAFDAVCWEIDPQVPRMVESIPTFAHDVLYYAAREAIRNAAQHGRRGAVSVRFQLSISIVWQDGLCIQIEDNGCGIGPASSLAGNTPGSGHGQGLTLHSTMMAVIGGSLSVESQPDQYTRIRLFLPQAAPS
jgi:signal transduction histidine kinase